MLNKLQIGKQAQLAKVVAFTSKLLVKEHCFCISKLEEGEMSMCTFFANVKSSLLWHWEQSIVAKSESFRKHSDKSQSDLK